MFRRQKCYVYLVRVIGTFRIAVTGKCRMHWVHIIVILKYQISVVLKTVTTLSNCWWDILIPHLMYANKLPKIGNSISPPLAPGGTALFRHGRSFVASSFSSFIGYICHQWTHVKYSYRLLPLAVPSPCHLLSLILFSVCLSFCVFFLHRVPAIYFSKQQYKHSRRHFSDISREDPAADNYM